MNTTTSLDSQLWAAAYDKVAAHLRAYGVSNHLFLHQLAEDIVANAAARYDLEPGRDPLELATEESERYLYEWIDHLVGPTDETPARRFARGRAAVYFSRLPERWPDYFLQRREPPPELAEELRATYLQAGPDFEFASMVPRPIDLGLVSSVADETWRTFAKWPVLRGVTICALFVSMLGTAFYLVRF